VKVVVKMEVKTEVKMEVKTEVKMKPMEGKRKTEVKVKM
jgi:hypothetical protein